jgi:hypothetical protein
VSQSNEGSLVAGERTAPTAHESTPAAELELTSAFDLKIEFVGYPFPEIPHVCYALAHNRIPFVESIAIRIADSSVPKKISVKVFGEWAANERSPIKEVEFALDAPALGDVIQVEGNGVQLSDVALADLEERAPATLVFRLTDDLGRAQDFRFDIEVYSRDQWLSRPEVAVVTAAFVQPNHPDVNRVLSRAGEILKRNGTPGISGYQASQSGQHHRIAAAIFMALQEFIKTYINPPASFESLGQKLRPIDRVLEEKQGTCIDLACAYASCLEQAGLHPVIFLVKGHAFAGYITELNHLNSSLIKEWPAIKSLLDSGLIVGVETVCIPGGESFDEAQAEILPHLNELRMEGVLDVSRAHKEGVRPLPARILRDNVVTVVIDNGPASAPIIERRDPATRKLLPESVPARIQSWKNSLLDLSFRNRLLNLRPERHGIELIAPIGTLGWVEDQLNDGSAMTIVALDGLNAIQKQIAGDGLARSLPPDQLVEAAKVGRMVFCGIDTNRFKSAVTRLRSEARLQEEESGANSLYLALGSVTWGPKYGEYRSPVFLVPIRINKLRGLNGAVIEMDATQTSSVNYCLIEALRLREHLTLQWFSDDMSDDLGLNVEAGLEALRKEFREKGLDQNGFSVDQTASIALLDFEKFRLWKDLNDHWKDFMNSPVVKHLVETPRETFREPAAEQLEALRLTDVSTICAQPADGSQIRAIERALAGASFVLQGPPGSGKSQTITNLLANAMNRGKKVLFVAEKQAALQEVQERLEAVKLGPYCLVLHDSGTKPEKLREQLREALDQHPKLEEKAHRTFEQKFEAAAHQLDEYRKHVYAPNRAGFSFARAYYRLGELGEGSTAEIPRTLLDSDLEVVGELQKNLLEIDDITRPAQVRPEHPWVLVGDIAFENLDRTALGAELTAALSACANLVASATSEISDALTSQVSAEGLSLLADILELREMGHLPTSAEWQAVSDTEWRSSVELWLVECERVLADVTQETEGHESFLRRTDLDAMLRPIAEAAKSFALGRKKRVREALGPFTEIIDKDSIDPELVVAKVGKVAKAARSLRTVTSSLVELKGLGSLLSQPPVTQAEVDALRVRAELVARIASAIGTPGPWGASLRAVIASTVMAAPGLSKTIRTSGETLRAVFARLGSDGDTLRRWSDKLGLIKSVHERSRKTWEEAFKSGSYLSLQRWIVLRSTLKPYREAGLATMCEAIEDGSLSADEAAAAFERGLLITTLQVRAEETNLDVFNSAAHNSRVAKFIQLLNERRERAQMVIPYYLHRSRTINAGVTTGKVGEFRREVSTPAKRRRGKSIRFLIERYPDIISDLTPCFLMSPDSVAQFLPPGKIDFDIVVFDEASQIVVADAIGALGRAKSCVIVGDSKQMPPTKFGVVDATDEEATELEAEGAVEEEESILEEAVSAGFHQELLTWHYRSQDESLIAFSNEHYYDRRLSTFPAPVQFRPDCGVFYRRVEGQFDHGKTRTNAIEANAIIEELVKRLDDPATAGLSYGIVTLNIQQRNLITELLDQHSHPRIQELRDTEDKKRRLFVLNLENVQGRERDVIILGTAFSKRVGGGAMPLNFGPLTNVGGEKRLNVAVTRAKRQFVVVSSFDPEEMGSAKSLGMVHLREYLKAARRREARERMVSSGQYAVTPQIAQVAERLRDRGVKVEVGMGLSNFKIDMALTLPEFGEKWLVAVLFDGEEWSERPLAIDRDALPVIVLEGVMSWRRVARVWMPSLRLELDAVVDELVEHVQVAKDMPEPTPPPPPPVKKSEPDDAETSEATPPKQREKSAAAMVERRVAPKDEILPNQEQFNEFQFPVVPYDASALLTTYAQGLLERLVDTEGPMRTSTAIKRVAHEFGLQRVRDSKLDELEPLLQTRRVTEILDERYVWPQVLLPDTWRAFRKTTKDQRKLEDISPYEIVNAMEVTVRRSITISVEELVRWTGEFFGAGRITEKVEDYLADCIAWAVVTRRFHLEDGQLTRGE